MNNKFMHPIKITLLLLLFSTLSFSQEAVSGDAKKGQDLFKQNCSSCHALDKQLVGPALKGVVTRLKTEQNLGVDWLQKWIKDNKALRASGDKYANEIFEKFKKSEMQVFPNLTEQDINDVLAYTENPPVEEKKDDKKETTTTSQSSNDSSSRMMIVAFLCIIGLLVWIAVKLNSLVKVTEKASGVTELQEQQITSFRDFYTKNEKGLYVGYALIGLFALYGVWAWLFGIGVDKGYKPEQPIYFSHKIHAGINGIDCQQCHTSAKYGKVSGIPSLNLCMNCHRNISEYKGEYIEPGKSRDFYTQEIKKIYEHVGWDEGTQTYSKPQTPIKWTRIHNMPDFVHFNHAQHVVAGEKGIMESYNEQHPDKPIDVVCKACHGEIDTMNVVQMANDFTMGWCIECHRTTKVDMKNGYNAEYFKKLHSQLKEYKGKDTPVTVDAIGGLECGKCHY